MSKLVNLVKWKFGLCHAEAVKAIAAVKLKNEGVLKGMKKVKFLRMIKEITKLDKSEKSEAWVDRENEKKGKRKWRRTCKFCYRIFFSNQTRDRHIQKVHIDDQEISCEEEVSEPNKVTEELEIENDVKNTSEHSAKVSDRVKCEMCGKDFSHGVSLKRHMKIHEETTKLFECNHDGCEFKTLRKDNYWKHRRVVHHLWKVNFDMLQEGRDDSVNTCKICGKSFAGSSSSFENHVVYKTCQNSAEDVNEEGRHQCNQCSRSYTNKSNLAKHMEWKHREMQVFECESCGKTFSTPSNLRRHTKQKHNSN